MTSEEPKKFRLLKATAVVVPGVVLGLTLALEREVGGTLAAVVTALGSSEVAIAFLLLVLALVAVRTALWLLYRPTPVPEGWDLPSVTVVIPAFNEGARVERAIESVAASGYPSERLRILCIDDGSTDDTYRHARLACERVGCAAEALRLPSNRGKRHAAFAGMVRARSEVIVTLDSDSELEPGALHALVAPLASERVGGVAGRVLVRNRNQNLLTRMLWVQYVIGFDFTRAYQSMLGTVFCSPGACAAYRRSVVAPWLEAWRDQRFLGARCTNGDDHHMTNVVLRQGLDVVYQSTASVHTDVPATYSRLTRMYVRWARSNIRESMLYLGFGFGRAVRTRRLFPLIDALFRVATNTARPLAFAALCALTVTSPAALLSALAATTVGGALYAAYYLRFERSTDVLYGVLYAYYSFLTLQWIYPYAFATVRRNGWLTR